MKVRPVKVSLPITALRYKPEDFYGEYEDSLWLYDARIKDAAYVAYRLTQNGNFKPALLLICKIADGYRQYHKKCQSYSYK